MKTILTVTTNIEVELTYEQHCAAAAEAYIERARSELGRARIVLEGIVRRLGPLRAASVPPAQSADLLESQLIEKNARRALEFCETALESLA